MSEGEATTEASSTSTSSGSGSSRKRFGKMLKNVYSSAKNHKKVSLAIAGAGLLGAGILGAVYSSGRFSGGNEIYEGILKDDSSANVRYVENIHGNENRMTVKKGGYVWEFYDTEDATDIDLQAKVCPNFSDDTLERIVIRNASGRKMPDGRKVWDYKTSQIGDQTVDGEKAVKVFEAGNFFYNNRRERIRLDKRILYDGSFDKTLDALKIEIMKEAEKSEGSLESE